MYSFFKNCLSIQTQASKYPARTKLVLQEMVQCWVVLPDKSCSVPQGYEGPSDELTFTKFLYIFNRNHVRRLDMTRTQKSWFAVCLQLSCSLIFPLNLR